MTKSMPLLLIFAAVGCETPSPCAQSETYLDADSDGFGDSDTVTMACPIAPGRVAVGGDCNDEDPSIHPDGVEVCNGGIDDDCSGHADDDDEGLDPSTLLRWYEDADGDGFGDEGDYFEQCAQPPGTTSLVGDCNDQDPYIHPDALEICSGLDEDCDTLIDDDDDSVERRCRGVIYMVSESDQMLHSLDPDTLTVSTIGPTTADPLDHGDLAWHAGLETLLMTHGEGEPLYTVDLYTGAAVQTASITGRSELYGLAYHIAEDTMYAYDDYFGGYILEVNPLTGAAIEVSQTSNTGIGCMAYDSTRDMLVTLGGLGLHSLDPITGQSMSLAEWLPRIPMCAITYDPISDLLWAVAQGNLFQIDPTAGYATTIVLNNTPDVMAIQFVP